MFLVYVAWQVCARVRPRPRVYLPTKLWPDAKRAALTEFKGDKVYWEL